MPTFTEVLPATKSCDHTSIRWTPEATAPARGCLIVSTRRDITTYAATEFPADGGRAFRLVKLIGGTDRTVGAYSVFIATPGGGEYDTCECKGFLASNSHCRHVSAMRAILENAELWRVAALVAPAVNPIDPDAALNQLLGNLGMKPDAPHWSDDRDPAEESKREAEFMAFLAERDRLIATASAPAWIVSGTWYTVRRDVGPVVETWADRRCVGCRLATDADEVDRMNGRLSSYTLPGDTTSVAAPRPPLALCTACKSRPRQRDVYLCFECESRM